MRMRRFDFLHLKRANPKLEHPTNIRTAAKSHLIHMELVLHCELYS